MSSHGRTAQLRWRAAMGMALLLVGCSEAPPDQVTTATTSSASSSAAPGPSGPGTSSLESAPGSTAGSTGTQAGTPAGTGTASQDETPTGTSSAPLNCDEDPCYLPPVDLGFLTEDLAPEASGIAPSSTDPDVFYIVDDATDTDQIIAVDGAGIALAAIAVTDMQARNAEALTPGPCAEATQKCLYIGDIGDNAQRRAEITVYRIAEPTVASGPTESGEFTELGPVPSERWDFTYPDGPRNAEAMLVADDASVVIITKPEGGQTPHEIYRGSAGGGELVLVNSFTPPRALKPLQSILIGTVVTDATRLQDRVLLLTYDQAIEYLAPATGADPALFSEWPYRQVEIPGQWQSEGVTYLGAAGLDSCGFLVASEKGAGAAAQLGRVDCT